MKILLKVCGEGTKRWSSSSGTLYKILQELRKRAHVALYGRGTKNVGIVVLNLLQLSFGVLVFVFVSPHHSCKIPKFTNLSKIAEIALWKCLIKLPWS